MKLNPEQIQKITEWVSETLSLGEIQRKINEELGLSLTYMEARFLVDDLGLALQNKPSVEDQKKEDAPSPAQPGESDDTQPFTQDSATGEIPQGSGGVDVTVDSIVRPGALVSGSVVFSDGMKATWYVDQFGRLGLAPTQTGYQPSPGDIQEFQLALQEELRKKGL